MMTPRTNMQYEQAKWIGLRPSLSDIDVNMMAPTMTPAVKTDCDSSAK